jgi:hypothetical protein
MDHAAKDERVKKRQSIIKWRDTASTTPALAGAGDLSGAGGSHLCGFRADGAFRIR